MDHRGDPSPDDKPSQSSDKGLGDSPGSIGILSTMSERLAGFFRHSGAHSTTPSGSLTAARILLSGAETSGSNPAGRATHARASWYDAGGVNDDTEAKSETRVGATLLDKYTLEELIGIGGMAAVYRARHRTGRVCAVKIRHDGHMATDAQLKRIRRECLRGQCPAPPWHPRSPRQRPYTRWLPVLW